MRGTLIRLVMAVAATASGGEMIAPNTNPITHGRPKQKWQTAATPTAVNSTSPTASSEIARNCLRNARQSVLNAAA